MNPKAILFDLDGTLADTARDIFAAINLLLAQENKPPLNYTDIRKHVALGGLSIVQFAFGSALTKTEQDSLLQRFLKIYAQNLCAHTRLFPGVKETLTALAKNKVTLGVVTNKLQILAEPLLEQIGVYRFLECAVYGDTTPHKKPHPQPLMHASQQIGIDPRQCIYVGDSVNDMKAADAAQMYGVFANYGYGSEQLQTQDFSPAQRINRFADIMNLNL